MSLLGLRLSQLSLFLLDFFSVLLASAAWMQHTLAAFLCLKDYVLRKLLLSLKIIQYA